MEINKSSEIKRDDSVFGVGSFIFSINLSDPKKIEDIILDFSGCLKNIPGLSSLRVEADFDSPRKVRKGELKLGFLNYEFELDLSTDPLFSTKSNKYLVTTKSLYDSSVTVVSSLENSALSFNEVIRVREYIKKYLRGACSLDVIGPSPFHATFNLHLNARSFDLKLFKQRGYDEIEVFSTKSSIKDAVDEFLFETEDEFNLFYLIRSIESSRIDSWDKINIQLEKIRESNSGGFFRKLISWYSLGFKITKIMQDVIEFESDDLSSSQLIKERFSGIYKTEEKYIFDLVRQEMDEVYKYPIDSVKKLIDYYILSRNYFNQNLSTILSGIIGGILGSSIALFVK